MLQLHDVDEVQKESGGQVSEELQDKESGNQHSPSVPIVAPGTQTQVVDSHLEFCKGPQLLFSSHDLPISREEKQLLFSLNLLVILKKKNIYHI